MIFIDYRLDSQIFLSIGLAIDIDCQNLDRLDWIGLATLVLLPVVIDIITTKNVTTIESPLPPPPPSPLEDPLHSITYP